MKADHLELALRDERVLVLVHPDRGGSIHSLVDTKKNRDWVWRSEGGWNEAFPNDPAGQWDWPGLGKRELPEHGELWRARWEVIESSHLGVRLSYLSKLLPVTIEKTICLPRPGKISLSYRIRNLSEFNLPFLFKLRAAIEKDQDDRLVLPPCWAEPEDSAEFFYATRLNDGYCGIQNERDHSGILLRFDLKQLPYAWITQSSSVAVLEPSTNIPRDLEAAYQNRTCGILPQEGERQIDIEVRLL
jgi:hypothetical protein